MPSHEDVFTAPEDVPSLDSGSFDSSGQSLYFLDDAGPTDDTANTSLEEVQIGAECFPPVEDDISMVPEVPSSLDSSVQFETAVPSPVSTPQVLPELLDPPIGSALDATSNVFTPEIIITPKKTHLLVEAVHVPLEPTPPAFPTPPVSNDEAVASDGDLALDSTTPVRPPTSTFPSPTPPTQSSNAPTPDILTLPEHARRPVEPIHLLPVQPVQTRLEPQVSTPHVVEPAPASTSAVPSAPKIDVTTSRKLSLTSKPAPEVVRPPIQPVQSRPEPQVLTPPVVIKPAPSSSATVLSAPFAALRKLSLISKPAPEPVEPVRPTVQHVQLHPEPQVLAAPVTIKRAPSNNATVPPVAASRKLSLTSKTPEPQQVQVQAVRPLVQPVQAQVSALPITKPAPEPVEPVRTTIQHVQSHPERQVLAAPVAIKRAPSSSATVPSVTVVAPRKLSLTSKTPEPQQVQVQAVRPLVQPVQAQVSALPIAKPAPEPVEPVRPAVQHVQSHPEPQVIAAPVVIKRAPSSSTTVPSAPVPASRKLSLTSKQPEPQQVQAVRPPVQPAQAQVSAPPITKPAPASIAAVPSSHKPSISSKPEPQQEVVRPPVQPVLAHPVLQVPTPSVIKPDVASGATVLSAPKSDVAASQKPIITPKPATEPVEIVRPPVQPMQAQPAQVATSAAIKTAPLSSATVPSAPIAAPRNFSLTSKPAPELVEAVRPPVQPVQAQPGLQVIAPPVIKPAPSSSATATIAASSPVAVSHNLTLASKPVPKQVETVRPPAQPVQAQLAFQVSAPPVIKPTPSSSAAVPSAPKSDVPAPAPNKPTLTSRSAPEQGEVVRPPVQAQAHPVTQVSSPPVIKPVPSRSAAAPSAPEHARPRVEPVPSPNVPARIPEAPTPPLQGNPATASRVPAPDRVSVPESARPRVEMVHGTTAPAPERVAAVPESTRPRAGVEMVHRPVQPALAHQSFTSSTGGRPALAAIASTPGKTIPAPDRTRSLATEAVRTPAQHSRPVGNVSATGRTTYTPSGTRYQAAAVPRPVQDARPTPGSSAVPVRHGPVPAGSVPSPNMVRLPPQYTRSQVGAGHTSTRVSHAPPASRVPPLGSTPAGSAPVPEVSRRIKSHPRKMVTTVGQRRSVVMPAPPVTQPTAPPPELPKAPPVQQPTARLAPQNSSSLPLQGVSTRMSSIPSLEAQDKPKIRTAPTPAPAVPTAPSPATPLAAAPPTRVDDVARAPTPTLRERASRMSITDGPTAGRSRRPTIVAEPETPRRAVRASVLSPMNPEQSATGPLPSRSSSSTPIARQDRASVVLPDTSAQKRADPASMPVGRDFTGTSTATGPAPASRTTNAAAPVGHATVLPSPVTPKGSPTPPPSKVMNPIREPRSLTPLPEPAPQMTARLSAQLVTLSKQQQQTEPVTSSLLNSDHVAITRRSETRKSSYYGSRTETPGVVSGAETRQGEPRNHYSATAVSRQQQVGSVDVVPGPVLRSSTQRITSRIRTRDLINRHKPQPATPSTVPSVGSPTWSKSPTSATSQPTPTTPDPNRTDSGIEIWDYNRNDRHRASNILANGDKKGPSDGAKLPTVLESSDRRSSRVPLHHRESTMSISKSHSKSHKPSMPSPPSSPREPALASPPKTTDSPQVDSLASTPLGRGGAFLTRKPQGSFQSGYPETSTPPRSSTPSSMTHASTAATSTQATLVTPASSFPNLSLTSKAQPKSWFRRNVLDPFKTKLGLAAA
jgi:hypothetical protein